MTELNQSVKNLELSILKLEEKYSETKKALVSLKDTETKLNEKIEQYERELKILIEMREDAMKPLPMKKRKWRHSNSYEYYNSQHVSEESSESSLNERPFKRRRESIDSGSDRDGFSDRDSDKESDRDGAESPTSANSTMKDETYINKDVESIDNINVLMDDITSKKLPQLLSNIPCSTICHAYPIPTTIELIEGFNYRDVGVQPGGKRNSAKDTLPQQVIELKGYYKESMACKVEVLGLIKKHNKMEVIGYLDKQKFIQTADNRYLAMFNNCCCRFSSHSYGQKLSLRFTLLDDDNDVCSVDSKCFQTITRRGREKQNKKLAQKGGWSQKHIFQLLDGVKKYGHNAFSQILKNYEWEQWQTLPVLQKKYLQLLKA